MKIPGSCSNASLFAWLLLLPVVAKAQLPEKVDGENIKSIISTIASDAYQGRETGTRGCEMAEDYFAGAFKQLKLVPLGDSGTYYYHYTIPNEESPDQASLVIDERAFYQGYNEDFSVAYKSDVGEAEAEIVFAGYGIYNPEKNRNDFDSIDVKNKIVLIKRGAPRNDLTGWMPSCIDSVKAAFCHEHGALGVLFFEPMPRSNQRILMPNITNQLAKVSVLSQFPVFTVDERVVRYIMANSGQSYFRLLYTLESQTSSFKTGRMCAMSAQGTTKPFLSTRNVIGMITGTDKKLKHEYILIGGHIDHIGMDASGNIRNGADDNASGSAVTLGIAQAMVQHHFKPKRSIVFVGWTGEEMGLLGSKAWCEKPTLDLEKIVVYFNLDMVGLGNGSLNMPGTEFAPEVYEFIKKNMDTTTLKRIKWSDGGPGGSDHNHFLVQGVPAFAGMTDGSHPDYHQTGDDPEKIKADILQFTGDFIYACTEKIATAEEPFITAQRFEDNRLKLLNYYVFSPVYSKTYLNDLKKKNFRLAVVNFSDMDTLTDPDKNFIALLDAYDRALKANSPVNRCVMTTTAYDAMMTRSGLLGAFDPDAIQMDELKFKVLAKMGYRFAVLDSGSTVFSDTAKLEKIVKIVRENGVGLLLHNLNPSALDRITSAASDPCMIRVSESSMLSDMTTKNIRDKKHLIVFCPSHFLGMEDDLKRFTALVNLVGMDCVLVSPESVDMESLRYFQRFIEESKVFFPEKEFQRKISGDNFYPVAVKSLQAN